jgi:hypothetical protein
MSIIIDVAGEKLAIALGHYLSIECYFVANSNMRKIEIHLSLLSKYIQSH